MGVRINSYAYAQNTCPRVPAEYRHPPLRRPAHPTHVVREVGGVIGREESRSEANVCAYARVRASVRKPKTCTSRLGLGGRGLVEDVPSASYSGARVRVTMGLTPWLHAKPAIEVGWWKTYLNLVSVSARSTPQIVATRRPSATRDPNTRAQIEDSREIESLPRHQADEAGSRERAQRVGEPRTPPPL